jgi:hypothetical protein
VPFLEGLAGKDLGLALNNQDFVAIQDMNEESRQEINWRRAFGTDGPVLRTIVGADEDTLNFTAIVLKGGAVKGLNRKSQLKKMRDFEVMVRYGDEVVTYRSANWTRISVRSTHTEVMLDCDISIPGFVNDAVAA